MEAKTRQFRHGKPRVEGKVENPGFTAETVRRGFTARSLVEAGRATTLRQARKILARKG